MGRRKPVLVSLDGVLLQGSGLLRSTYRQMINEDWIGPEANPNKRDAKGILRHMGHAVTGKTFDEVNLLGRRASRLAVKQLDQGTLGLLRSLSPKNHQLIGLTSSPDFSANPALNWLNHHTDLSFNTATVLSSTFKTENGVYTGEYEQLDKDEAVDNLVREFGGMTIKLGLINGMTDANWSEKHCDDFRAINPGPALSRHLELISQQPAAATS